MTPCSKEKDIKQLEINYTRMEERFDNIEKTIDRIERKIELIFTKLEQALSREILNNKEMAEATDKRFEKLAKSFSAKWVEIVVSFVLAGSASIMITRFFNLI